MFIICRPVCADLLHSSVRALFVAIREISSRSNDNWIWDKGFEFLKCLVADLQSFQQKSICHTTIGNPAGLLNSRQVRGYRMSFIARHLGNVEHPQNFLPALLPLLAVR